MYVLGRGTWLPRGPRGFAPVDSNVPVQVHVGPMDRVTSDSISNNTLFNFLNFSLRFCPPSVLVELLRPVFVVPHHDDQFHLCRNSAKGDHQAS